MLDKMYPAIRQYIGECDLESVHDERKKVLQPLIEFIQSKTENNETVKLNFICTHNSRRSAFAQVWAQTMAHYTGVSNVMCFSGGTESTALFPMVANTLETVGFNVVKESDDDNPKYQFSFTDEAPPEVGFSKKWNDSINPQSHFAAVMTCSQADQDCPVIFGSEKRIAVPYDDPKAFDGTHEMEQKYSERCRQIATEMKYVFATVSQ